MNKLLLALLALMVFAAGCAHGVSPTEPCPSVVIYVSFDDHDMVTDTIDYHPDC